MTEHGTTKNQDPDQARARLQALEKLALSDASGDRLFNVITETLAAAFAVRWVGFGIRDPKDGNTINIVSIMDDGQASDPFSFPTEGSPCGALYANAKHSPHIMISDKIAHQFPTCMLLMDIGAVSYLGEVILDDKKMPVAHVLLMDDKPLALTQQEIEFFRLVSLRAGAEYRRSSAEAQLEAVVEERERVLASICHDLSQTPFAAQLLVMKLQSDANEDDDNLVLDQLATTLNSMSELLDDLRAQFADSSNQKVDIVRQENISARQLFAELEGKYLPMVEQKKVKLTFYTSNIWFVCDPHLLKVILGNLISNAIRYTPKGRILVSCRGKQGKIMLEVWDTGIGIDADDMADIFSSYFRGRNVYPVSSEHPGYGLGLSIVERKVKAIGARMDVKSYLGQGSVFSLTLAAQEKPVA